MGLGTHSKTKESFKQNKNKAGGYSSGAECCSPSISESEGSILSTTKNQKINSN
jgi:hypothetical protein